MPIVAEVRGWRVVVGGEARPGGLTGHAAVPPRTPKREVVVDARIEYEDGDYHLTWMSPDRSERDTSSHETLSDAKAEAELELGIPLSAWQAPKGRHRES